jgi:hypothetical protein
MLRDEIRDEARTHRGESRDATAVAPLRFLPVISVCLLFSAHRRFCAALHSQESFHMNSPRRVLVLITFSSAALCTSAQDRSYGRSVVSSQYGIVATSQILASQAGARVLEQGRSAVDAGIAANGVLGVTEPAMNGMGGDLFAIYWEAKTGKLYGFLHPRMSGEDRCKW